MLQQTENLANHRRLSRASSENCVHKSSASTAASSAVMSPEIDTRKLQTSYTKYFKRTPLNALDENEASERSGDREKKETETHSAQHIVGGKAKIPFVRDETVLERTCCPLQNNSKKLVDYTRRVPKDQSLARPVASLPDKLVGELPVQPHPALKTTNRKGRPKMADRSVVSAPCIQTASNGFSRKSSYTKLADARRQGAGEKKKRAATRDRDPRDSPVATSSSSYSSSSAGMSSAGVSYEGMSSATSARRSLSSKASGATKPNSSSASAPNNRKSKTQSDSNPPVRKGRRYTTL